MTLEYTAKRVCRSPGLGLRARRLIGLGLVSAVAACGGGGGGSDGSTEPPPAPAVTQDAGIRQLLFNWDRVEGANAYRLQANLDGNSGFTQVGGNLSGSATGVAAQVSVHQLDWDNATFLVEACNQSGCRASNALGVADQMLDAIGYFKASNTDADDQFGHALALSADGTTLAVSAPSEDSAARDINGGEGNSAAHRDAGAVYVFVRDGLGWEQQAYIKPTNTDAFDEFGFSLDLSADGNTLAIGARNEDSSAFAGSGNGLDNDVENAGAAYVFVRADDVWSQDVIVKASNNAEGDQFGSAVALSGDGATLAVGAVGEDGADGGINGNEDNNAAEDAGAVYIYVRTANGWQFDTYVKAFNPSAFDGFGGDLALDQSGDTLAVGAMRERSNAVGINGNGADNSLDDAGAVYVFRNSGGSWEQQAYVKASNTDASDFFGRSLSLSDDGDTLAVGAFGEDSRATGIDGNEADDTREGAGAVYVYTRSGTTWQQRAYIKASNTGALDLFGFTVDLSGDGNSLAVGAAFEQSADRGVNADQMDDSLFDAGAVYFFTFENDAWRQQSYIKAPNAEEGDQFGSNIALDEDGSLMAIGARFEAGDVAGIGGAQDNNDADNAGAVYLY